MRSYNKCTAKPGGTQASTHFTTCIWK